MSDEMTLVSLSPGWQKDASLFHVLDPKFCVFCFHSALCFTDQCLQAASASKWGIGRQVVAGQGGWVLVERDIQAGRMLLDQILFGGVEVMLKPVELFRLRAQ